MASNRRSQSLDPNFFLKRKRSSVDIEDIADDAPPIKFAKHYADSSPEYALIEPIRKRRVNGRIYLRPFSTVTDIYEVFERRRATPPLSPTLQSIEDVMNTPPDRSERSASTSSRKRLRRVSDIQPNDEVETDSGWNCSECTVLNPDSRLICSVCHIGMRPRDDVTSPPGSGSGKTILNRLLSGASATTSRIINKITEPFRSPPPVPASRAIVESDKEDENDVHCARCTYINTPHALICGMCGSVLNSTENEIQDTIALSPVSSVEGEKDEEWVPDPKSVPVSSSARKTTLKRKFVSPQVAAPPVHDLTDANDFDEIEEFEDSGPVASSHPQLPHFRSVKSLEASGECKVDFKQFRLKAEKGYSPSKTKQTLASKGDNKTKVKGRRSGGRGGARKKRA